MIITGKKFQKANVETKSGQFLGQVIDFELQTDNTQIIKIYVATKIIIPGIYKNELIIHKDQIIDIKQDKIIVDDNVVDEGVKQGMAEVKKVEGVEKVEPVITSKGD